MKLFNDKIEQLKLQHLQGVGDGMDWDWDTLCNVQNMYRAHQRNFVLPENLIDKIFTLSVNYNESLIDRKEYLASVRKVLSGCL
jgi:hypothetical protein